MSGADLSTRPRKGAISGLLIVGLLLVVTGAVLLIARYLTAHYERHSFVDGQSPARYVTVEAGKTYWVSVRGGVKHEKELGQPPSALQCSAQQRNGPEITLDLTREGNDTKLVNGLASFRSPVSGEVHVTCVGLPDVYLDATSGDPSGVLLVVGTALLTIGVPLLLSGARTTRLRVVARRGARRVRRRVQIQPRRLNTR